MKAPGCQLLIFPAQWPLALSCRPAYPKSGFFLQPPFPLCCFLSLSFHLSVYSTFFLLQFCLSISQLPLCGFPHISVIPSPSVCVSVFHCVFLCLFLSLPLSLCLLTLSLPLPPICPSVSLSLSVLDRVSLTLSLSVSQPFSDQPSPLLSLILELRCPDKMSKGMNRSPAKGPTGLGKVATGLGPCHAGSTVLLKCAPWPREASVGVSK